MLPERFLIAGVEQVAQKAMTGMWITSLQTAARKLGGYVSEHQIENLDNFPRIRLLAYFEKEPAHHSGPPRRVAGVRTQQNAV